MSSTQSSSSVSPKMSEKLLAWYRAARRDLPWRQTHDPYRIWVSEIMLQQTQVATVIPYYARFLERFPTIMALAEASLDDLLAIWQGLGYYRRARAMHRAARQIVQEYDGQLPSDAKQLRALPGIGDYTAGALLSIAFGQDVPAIDGNVVRVICRLFDVADDPTHAAGKRIIVSHDRALLPVGQAGDFNQAMMELGALVCLPREPLCHTCPLRQDCQALARDTVNQRPLKRERAPVPHKTLAALIVKRHDRILLLHRVPQGLLGGLWELPGREYEPVQNKHALSDKLGEMLGVEFRLGAELGTIEHAYTHFGVTVHVFAANIEGAPAATGETWDDQLWLIPEELSKIGITGVTSKILAKMPWPGSNKLL